MGSRRRLIPQAGFFLLEAIVVIALFSLLALGYAYSVSFGMRMRQRMIHNSVAMQMAMEEIESLGSLDPATLDAGDNFTDTVTRGPLRFQRSITISVNANGSRTVVVQITDLNTSVAGAARVSNTYALWGSQ